VQSIKLAAIKKAIRDNENSKIKINKNRLTAAPHSQISICSQEHNLLGLNIPSHPRKAGEEMGVENLLDWCLLRHLGAPSLSFPSFNTD